MNLRIAHKVLKSPGRYSPQQQNSAAHRLYRYVRRHDRYKALKALYLKPVKFVVVDDSLDLKREQLEGQIMRENVGAPEPLPADPNAPPRPVYRKDGQIHAFDSIPWPGKDKRHHLTRARYDARYGNNRPIPESAK